MNIFASVLFSILFLYLYVILGYSAVVFEFDLKVPGIWGRYIRNVATHRPKLTRAFVLFAWPVCVTILVASLPIEVVLGVIRIINEPEKVKEQSNPSTLAVTATKRTKRFFRKNTFRAR